MDGRVINLIAMMLLSVELLFVKIGAQSGNDVNGVLTELFTTNRYNKLIRPLKNQTNVMDITVEFYLNSIIEFDEQREVIKISGFMALHWTDDYLAWDPSSHNGVTEFFVPQDDIWKPDVALLNSFKSFTGLGSPFLNVRVYNDGTVQWYPFQVLEATCTVDITYFPFDKQKCDLTFVAWSYTKADVNLNLGTEGINLDGKTPNNQWEIISTNAMETDTFDTSITFSVCLSRKPGFYLTNVVLPVILLSVLNCFTFVLPVSSGERASYAITVFLSLAVFLTIVASELPKNSDKTSLLSIYLMIMVSMSTTIVMICLVEIRIAARKEDTQPISKPYLVFYQVIQCLRCRTCGKHRVGQEFENGVRRGSTQSSVHKVDIQDGVRQSPLEDGHKTKCCLSNGRITWEKIVDAIDFAFFWICVIFTVLCTVVIMTTASKNNPGRFDFDHD